MYRTTPQSSSESQKLRQAISQTVFENNDRFHLSEFDLAATYKDEFERKKATKNEAPKTETVEKEAVEKSAEGREAANKNVVAKIQRLNIHP